jgi:hypothetical protein
MAEVGKDTLVCLIDWVHNRISNWIVDPHKSCWIRIRNTDSYPDPGVKLLLILQKETIYILKNYIFTSLDFFTKRTPTFERFKKSNRKKIFFQNLACYTSGANSGPGEPDPGVELKTSVGDPDPQDPHVFGPPGSGSIS